MPTCTILRGIPCSGKSTWANKQSLFVKIISCYEIRKEMFGKHYTFSSANEVLIWDRFYLMLSKAVEQERDIVIDNTNIRPDYVINIIERLKPEYNVIIKYFPISLHKAIIRNYIRYITTGEWIPIKVIKRFYKDYKKL